MLFKYKGINSDFAKVNDKIEALDLKDAKAKLRNLGITYSFLKEEKALFNFDNFTKEIDKNKLADISRDLSIFLNSGISLVNAIKLLQNQYKRDKNIANFLSSINFLLDEGKSFFQALDEQKVVKLPAFYKHSIKVAQDNGIIAQVLDEMASYLKEQTRLNKNISQALAYPSFIFIVAIFAIAFMLSVVVPKITSIFVKMEQEMPPITEFVINAGDFFKNQWQSGLILFLVFFVIYKTLIYKSEKLCLYKDYLLLKSPVFGKLILYAELGRFSYLVSILAQSGVSFVHSVKLSSTVVNNTYMKKIFIDASAQLVEGKKLSNALNKNVKDLDESFIQALGLAEHTSEVNKILKNLSAIYFEKNKDKIALLLSLLEPVMMLFVGTVIGFIITAMLLPIFSINLA